MNLYEHCTNTKQLSKNIYIVAYVNWKGQWRMDSKEFSSEKTAKPHAKKIAKEKALNGKVSIRLLPKSKIDVQSFKQTSIGSKKVSSIDFSKFTLSQRYFRWSNPYGDSPTLHRYEWYISRIEPIYFGDHPVKPCLNIVLFHSNLKRFCFTLCNKTQYFDSFKDAVAAAQKILLEVT